MDFAHHVIKAPIVLGPDVDISVAEEDMLLELSDAVELLVAEIARVVILELKPEPLRSIRSAILQMTVELPFGREGLLTPFTRHITCPVKHVAAYVLLLNDLSEVGV